RDDPGARFLPEGQVACDNVAHHPFRNDGVGFGEDGAAGQKLVLRRQSAMRRVITADGRRGVLHWGSISFSLSSAMRSTSLQAVSNSVSRLFPTRRSKAARISSLVFPRTAMMKGKPNFST